MKVSIGRENRQTDTQREKETTIHKLTIHLYKKGHPSNQEDRAPYRIRRDTQATLNCLRLPGRSLFGEEQVSIP